MRLWSCRPLPRLSVRVVVVAAMLLAAACGGTGSQPAPAAGTASVTAAAPASRANVSLNKNDYPVFPNADAGADPSVPAEQGGRGFTGEGWQTNTEYELIGDPRAVKGGQIREYQGDFPTTLRRVGPSTQVFGATLEGLAYESLLGMHPSSLDYIPALATHWQISQDKLSYRFRIDPNARWSDGQPVVADDVVATYNLLMDKGIQDPAMQLVFGKFEKPVAESRYIVGVKSKQLNWRNFMYFSGMPIFPAHVLKTIDGATYIKDYNQKMLPGTGPYVVNAADIVKGKSITITRRRDYWAEKQRRNVGLNNFDQIHDIVVRDQNLALEMFKKGDLDYYYVNISRQWVEALNFDKVERGLIQKRKIFNDSPRGLQGIAFNTRKAPWDDVRVRRALPLLFNRDLLIAKLFFNEYIPKNAFYGGIYENPGNPKNEYDPKAAVSLLAEAGWKDRDAQGRLTKNGQPLTLEVLYADKASEPFFTVFQEDLRKVGIGMNLRLATFETMIQLLDQRKFDLVSTAFSGGGVFPDPETMFSSRLADVNNSNNITGFKNARVDALLKEYDEAFDPKQRVAIVREIDGLIASEQHWILEWDAPFQRIAFWNKFGATDGYLTRIGDHRDLLSLWWRDPEKEAQLAKAQGDSTSRLPAGVVEVRYWQEYAKQHGAQGADAPR